MFNKDFNIVEYSFNSKKNRHHFHNVTDQIVFKPTDKDVIKSVYLHTDELINYFNTHFKKDTNQKTLEGYTGPVLTDSLILDIDNDEDLNLSLATTRNFISYMESTYEVDPSWLKDI